MEKYNLFWKYPLGESKIRWFNIAHVSYLSDQWKWPLYEVAGEWPDILAKTTRFQLLIFPFVNVQLYRDIFYTTVSIRIESNPC